MIIGINGRIGSGKDTIGNIIQYLTSECSKTSGKHFRTFQKWMEKGRGDNSYQGWYQSEWEIKKYAAKLKKIASILTGIPVEKFEDQEFKKTFLGPEWNYNYRLPRQSLEQENIYYEEKRMTIREFLQKLGTEAIRDSIHTNAWVNALFADYIPEEGIVRRQRNDAAPIIENNTNTGLYRIPDDPSIPENFRGAKINHHSYIWYENIDIPVYPNWVITDTRFPNEAQEIKKREGVVWRVNRILPDVEYPTLESLHPSEVSLDEWEFDAVIENNGTIEELIEKVKNELIGIGVLT